MAGRRPLTLVGLLGSPLEDVRGWLSHLEPYFDEILLIDDSSAASETARSLRRERKRSRAGRADKLRIIRRPFRADRGAARNVAQAASRSEWLLHVNLDERVPQKSLERLRALVDEVEAGGHTICGVSRRSTIDGALVNDIPQSEWSPSLLREIARAQRGASRAIRNPDVQFRLVHRSERWTEGMNEMPRSVAELSRDGTEREIVFVADFWLRCDKTIVGRAPTAIGSSVRRRIGSKRFRRSAAGEFRRGFSIAIPTWNNLAYLKKAVESLRLHSDYDHEIVVHVSDGSDGTLAWVREAGIKHTHTAKNVGICEGLNRATDLATRDLLMYWNEDMVALPEWDRHLVDYAEGHEIGELIWLSSTLVEPEGRNPDSITPADYGRDIERFDEQRLLADLPRLRKQRQDYTGTIWPPNLLYRDVFDSVGRLSEEFSPGHGSDPDLAKKLWDLGMRHFVGIGKSLVYHFQSTGFAKLPAHLHNDGYGTFFQKHGISVPDFLFSVLRRYAVEPKRRRSRAR